MSEVRRDPSINPGSLIAGYRLDALIAQGGMGVVYRATHLRLNRTDAVKIIAPDLRADEELQRRFLREARMAAALDHPNILPVYDAGEHDGQLYLAMRFIEGGDLLRRLKTQGALPPSEAIGIVRQIARALDAGHRAGFVHRDVKPANILMDGTHAYLSDFGLARPSASVGATATGFFVGSIHYCPPEQIDGKPIDQRSDIYALGCVLFHCLTGHPPYPLKTEIAVMKAQLFDPTPLLSDLKPDLPQALGDALAKAMAKDPSDRWPTAIALDRALSYFANDETAGDTARREPRPGAVAWVDIAVTSGMQPAAEMANLSPAVNLITEVPAHLRSPIQSPASTPHTPTPHWRPAEGLATSDVDGPPPATATSAAATSAHSIARRRSARLALSAHFLGGAIAVAGGIALGAQVADRRNATSSKSELRRIAAKGVSLNYTEGWRPEPVVKKARNRVTQILTLAGPDHAALVVLLDRSAGSLRPPYLSAQLRSEIGFATKPGAPSIVTTKYLHGVAYRVPVQGPARGSTIVYAFPTTNGLLVGACAPMDKECSQSVASMRYAQVTVLPIEPNAAFADAINSALNRFVTRRALLRTTLRQAKTRAAQATTAVALARLAHHASAAMFSLNGDSVTEKRIARSLAIELRMEAEDYGGFAASARSKESSGAGAAGAARRIIEHDARIVSLLKSLSRLGYRVRA